MQTLHVNGYDMAYLEVGRGPPLVCVHGTLGDFRTWSAVLGPLSKTRRVISVSLRHFFPEHWDGIGNDYLMAQHVADVIAFIEKLDTRPVDLMGHSRGGHIAFRVAAAAARTVAQADPGRTRRRARCHRSIRQPFPAPRHARRGSPRRSRRSAARRYRRRADDLLRYDRRRRRVGAAAGRAEAAAARQCLHPDRPDPATIASRSPGPMRTIKTPTLFIGGADTKGVAARGAACAGGACGRRQRRR